MSRSVEGSPQSVSLVKGSEQVTIWRVRDLDQSARPMLPCLYETWKCVFSLVENLEIDDPRSLVEQEIPDLIMLTIETFPLLMTKFLAVRHSRRKDMQRDAFDALTKVFGSYNNRTGFEFVAFQKFLQRWIEGVEKTPWFTKTLPIVFEQINQWTLTHSSKKRRRFIRMIN